MILASIMFGFFWGIPENPMLCDVAGVACNCVTCCLANTGKSAQWIQYSMAIVDIYIYNIYICIPIALCILFALQTAKVFFLIFLDININPSKHMTYESHVSTLLGPLITTPGSVIRKAPKTGSSYRHGGAVYGRCHLPILAFAS